MSKSRYVIDAWAWLEYFSGSKAGLKVKEHLENDEAFTNAITVSEIVAKVNRSGRDVGSTFDVIVSQSSIVAVDEAFAKETGILYSGVKKLRPNFSLADGFVLYTAKLLNAKVLTGDPDFKGLKEAVMLF